MKLEGYAGFPPQCSRLGKVANWAMWNHRRHQASYSAFPSSPAFSDESSTAVWCKRPVRLGTFSWLAWTSLLIVFEELGMGKRKVKE
jgi:hypothetical protein